MLVSALATAISLGVNLTRYQQLLLLPGAFLVPLFGVLLADRLVAGRHCARARARVLRPGVAARDGGVLARRLLPLRMDRADAGPRVPVALLSHLHAPQGGIGASLPSFAVAFAVAAAGRRDPRNGALDRRIRLAAVRPLAVIGHLSRDVVAGAPRIGGGPWYAGRALRVLGDAAVLFAKCGDDERARFQRRLASLGLPASLASGGETTSFSFSYDPGGERRMRVEAVGEPWQLDEPPHALLRRVEWLHVAPLLRSDFDAAALERLGSGRRLLLDGQGLVRVPEAGELRLDRRYDPDMLRHVAILKVSAEEAHVLAGDPDPAALAELGVPEVLLTLGAEGSVVVVNGRAENVPARPVENGADPTGAGDAFAIAYLSARADGHAPASAARRATALVAALLIGGGR
ncbi:MAG: carbohydrate kinase family protein [Gaiellaceae bacterium]